MPIAQRRRTTWAIAASALAHVVVLLIALLYRPYLSSPVELAAGPPETMIPVLMMPRSHLARPIQPKAVAMPATRPSQTMASPLPAAPGQRTAQKAETAPPAAKAPATEGDAFPAPDIGLALRHGAAGCASAGAIGMTRAEREHCDERLAAGARTAPVLAVALEPRMRAYYDAVAKAKEHDKALTPQRAIGALGYFDGDPRGVTGHGPGIHCSVPFGAGPKPKLPAHWLKLGPCAIVPPQGPLTVEADITPP
jgi:hypothetical protein